MRYTEMMQMEQEVFDNYQAYVFEYLSTPFDLHDNCPEAYGEFEIAIYTDFFDPQLQLIGA